MTIELKKLIGSGNFKELCKFLFLKIKIIGLIKPVVGKCFEDQDVNSLTLRYIGKKGPSRHRRPVYVFIIHRNGTKLISKFKRTSNLVLVHRKWFQFLFKPFSQVKVVSSSG